MAPIRYNLTAVGADPLDVMSSRSPSYVVAFVRFAEPAAAYTDGTVTDRLETKELLVVESDVVAVSINNQKASFAKTCQLELRSGEFFYPGAVSPGDWVFVWAHADETRIDEVRNALVELRDTKKLPQSVCGWDSGLKFVGRVLTTAVNDSVSSTGVRNVTQSISCQSFLEFATSVYYSDVAQAIFLRAPTSAAQEARFTAQQQNATRSLKNLGALFNAFFGQDLWKPDLYPSPDVALAFYYSIAMGVEAEVPTLERNGVSIKGSISDAIDVPPTVAQLLDKPKARKLWELLNVYLGVQRYSGSGANVWERFSPEVSVNGFERKRAPTPETVTFLVCPTRLKGWVPYYPQPWTNVSLWSILSGTLNEPINELYTSLRVDRFGKIRPSLIAREKPLSTRLFDQVNTTEFVTVRDRRRGGPGRPKLSLSESEKVRTLYETVPRWVADDSVVTQASIYTTESDRVNFVQVWGTQLTPNLGIPQGPNNQANTVDTFREQALLLGNAVLDASDVARMGLRANIVQSSFDYPVATATRAPYWARLRADWLLNGHLKARARLTMLGVSEPIVEGDNLEFRGVVYHIEGVQHSIGVQADGRRYFMTTVELSNGILAESLDDGVSPPRYISQQGPQYDRQPGAPGTTDVQRTRAKNRQLPYGDRGSEDER